MGAQWNGAGSSLYGNYFVDRPPLLVSIFRCAASLGGITALRLIGADEEYDRKTAWTYTDLATRSLALAHRLRALLRSSSCSPLLH